MGKDKNFGLIIFFLLVALSLFPFISAPVAFIMGVIFINLFKTKIPKLGDYTKKVLQYSIVGLGFGMNLQMAAEAGSNGFLFSVFSIVLVFTFGLLLGKLLGIDRKIRELITVGTAICGGSAIAAISPVIKAENNQNSVALGIVFMLNAFALIIFPYIGDFFKMTQNQFGIWAAIAIHDTSSVVGAASKFGDEALHTATTVKLARALFIIPLAIIFSLVYKKETKVKFPMFILYFVIAILLNTYLPFLKPFTPYIADISKTGLKLALFLIGTGLLFSNFKTIGIRPFILGVSLWIFISVISFFATVGYIK